jgi:hypothetical protein
VTVDAEQSIFEQHRVNRELFESGARRPWEKRNQKVLVEWLSHNPKLVDL